jgi:hypothetical protein
LKNKPPNNGYSGKSIAARPKRILIELSNNSVKEKEGTIGMA